MSLSTLPAGSSLPKVARFSQNSKELFPATVAAKVFSQVEHHPEAAAIVSSTQAITYGELDRWSNAFAARLSSIGLTPNQAVGIYLESSVESIVAAVGVWKAGGAYLPIDPAYPADRAAFILADSGAPIVVTRRELASALVSADRATLCIEDVERDSGIEFAAASTSPDDLAYLIYTSGSTGQPKGVEITHGNLMNLVEWHVGEFLVGRKDRATQIAGPGFDAAVWEIWPYLASGASIHLASREERLSAKRLRDWLLAERITITFVPTVLAEEVLHLEWPERAELRYLLTGGDALHSYPPAGLPFRVVNNYGPTECTVVATSTVVSSRADGHTAPSIGQPILNTGIYLLDEDGREVGDGEVGEIYVSGPSVGRGYRNRPDLTASCFVPVTIGGRTERTYRTGDLAKKLPDGQLSFAGRADDQIKIRGFRIEPEEIASVLNRHAAVVSSAIVARKEKGEKRLVGYVVLAGGAQVSDRELREWLTKSLPDYMVPAEFVVLEHIPVTANGKLDKAALPVPAEHNQLKRDNYVAPRNELEEIVEGILGPILALPRVSIYDNFFLLGGHSLMGAQVIAKVRDIFDVELNLRNVFECPTVAKLAAKIEAALTARLEAMSEEEVHQALRRQVNSDMPGGGASDKAS